MFAWLELFPQLVRARFTPNQDESALWDRTGAGFLAHFGHDMIAHHDLGSVLATGSVAGSDAGRPLTSGCAPDPSVGDDAAEDEGIVRHSDPSLERDPMEARDTLHAYREDVLSVG